MNGQLAAVPVPSTVQVAVESLPNRTQQDVAKNQSQLRHDLADAVSTKSSADRALLNGQLAAVPVPSREQLAVEPLRNRTQRDEVAG